MEVARLPRKGETWRIKDAEDGGAHEQYIIMEDWYPAAKQPGVICAPVKDKDSNTEFLNYTTDSLWADMWEPVETIPQSVCADCDKTFPGDDYLCPECRNTA